MLCDLTPKQQRFVDEYLVDMNATQAAIRAGYSRKTAYSIGDENLRKPYISAEIAHRQRQIAENLKLTHEVVV
ncbi:MAG: terminase small subunit, partial [Acidobacteriota bacterium]|nr:terminase small subunit [Acidobacteriota bacterium]